ncbi:MULTISPECIES: DUF6531 domain-containing protein [Microbacterium]|uniref:DUF6531 domain-containing protein n=1 Tax=Microbacterium TaxID=33882 RepID=UPI0027845E13|nr:MULTISPECIES: DUF6531 domain-containing protein [Microbacterium]MDQ1083881.1 RHS repeat-associated protein [Microbacterium sp. SORGH_AS_0344]
MFRAVVAATIVGALVVTGGAVHAAERPIDRSARVEQQILDRVREAAAPLTTADAASDAPAPLAETTLQPGRAAVLTAEDPGVRAEFSGHDIDEPLALHATALDDRAATSAASETGGVVAAPPVEIRARTDGGNEVTRFPASYTIETDSSGIQVAKDIDPGVRLQLDVDADELSRAGVSLDSLRIYSRENPGDPWRQLPSYYDADNHVAKAESEHLSQFVVIGTPVQTTPVPRIVLDPDDDVGWANSPGPRITELPLNVRLADQLAGMFRDRCIADVTVTRGADQRFVSADTRRAIAASHEPDVMLTLAFATFHGTAWGTASNGGSQLFSRGGDGNALRDSLLGEMPGYTGRPAHVKAPTPDFPREEYQGLPGAVVHMETLFMDHNFDRPVIDNGWDSIVNGAFTGVGKYLESRGFSCTNPITGGWPARPSADELARWYQLGYRNWQHYGADPVSFSTGNLVETEHLFSISGVGESATDVSLIYNAQDGRLGRVGAGWTFGLGGRAQRFDDHSVMVVRGDGASIMFEPDGSGGYVDPRGEGLHLAEAGNGILRMTSRTGETWDYDAADQDGIGEMVRSVDASGRATTLTYGPPSDTQQFVPLTGLIDAAGQVVRVDSDGVGRVTAFVLPDGRAWSLGYDDKGDLVRVTAADGGMKTFTYDGAHRIATMTDALGVTYLRNAYDGAGRVEKQWDAAGNERRFSYGAGQTTYTDQEGREHTYTFDGRARITKITDPVGGEQSWTYNDDNNVTAFTDAAGRTTGYAYDSAGNVAEVTDAAGNATRYTYTPKGAVASRTDPLGRVTSYGYDGNGVLTTMVQPDGSAITYGVDAVGNTTRMTLPSGAAYTFEFDGRGNRTASTDPLGRTTRFTYDDGNRLQTSTDPLGRTTHYGWDARDRLTTIADPLGRTTTYAYDLNGNLTSSTDPAGNTTSYAWDALFRIVSATDALGGVTTYTYDREDGLTGVTDAAGRQTSFVLDALERATQVTDPAGQTWSRTYDAVGTPTVQTDPRGAETQQTVDDLGQVTATKGPTGVEQHTVYDGVGRVTAVVDGAGQRTSYEYDDLDRMTAVVDQLGHRTTYSFNQDGHLVGMTDRLGHSTFYEHDAAGQLTAVTDADGATAYGYDAAGNVVSVVDAVGRRSTRAYDDADQLVESVDAAGHSTRFEHDVLGNVTAVVDPNGHTTRATWNAAGQRTSTTDALGNTTTFGYDHAGQLTSTTDALGRVTTYAYEEHGQLASVTDPLRGVTRYTYDEIGLLASLTDARGKVTRYDNDAAGQPEQTIDATGGSTRYEYDSRGLLSRVVAPSGTAVSYAYDARGDRTSQSSASDAVRFEYDAEQRLIAASTSVGTTGWTYTATGRLASQLDAGGRELTYSYDPSGALAQLTVPTGQAIAYERDSAGRVLRMSSPWGSAAYAYDAGGNHTRTDRSNGVSTRYEYDAADRVTQMTTDTPAPGTSVAAPAAAGPVRTEGQCPIVTSTNAPALRAATVDKPGCVKPSSYLSRRTLPSDTGSLAQGVSLTLDYAYDAVGNVTDATRTATAPTASLPGGVTPIGALMSASDAMTTVLDRVATRYTYDDGDRVTGSVQSTGAADSYGYDETGNRTSWAHIASTSSSGMLDPILGLDAQGVSSSRPPASIATGSVQAVDASFTQTQLFNDLNQLVSTDGGTAGAQRFTYDADGHRVAASGGASGDVSYDWDAFGQLTGYRNASGATRFEYDGLGRRVSSRTGGVYGSTETATVWSGLQPVQDVSDVAGTTTLVRDVAGELLLEGRSSGTSTWDLLDRLGSAIAQVGDTRLASALNNPVQAARDALTDRGARVTQVSGGSDWGVPSFATSGWNAALGHSGEPTDPVAGVDLFYSRGYDTRSGSWLSRDAWEGTVDAPASLNGYAYVESNPVTSRDWLGFRPLGRYDNHYGTSRGGRSTAPRFTAPGLWNGPGQSQPDTSPFAPSKTYRGTSSKPKPVSPKSTSQTTARHAAGSVGVLSPGLPLIGAGFAAAAETAAAAAAALVLATAGAVSGMLLLSLSGDSSGIGIRKNEAAASTSGSSSAAGARSGSGSPGCDPLAAMRGDCVPSGLSNYSRPGNATSSGDELPGLSRRYEDLTRGGSVRNVRTDATPQEFAQNLLDSGWIKTEIKEGIYTFEKDGFRYTLRDRAKTFDGWSADYLKIGEKARMKIRFDGS